ncbi:MAG: insulinase family protein [Bergeyella sp.]|nr:insulinase family protein [Bergeyella sp.]
MDIDINKRPEPGPTPEIFMQEPKVFVLKNGLTVLVVENNKLPKVNISLKIDRPPVLEGEKVGIGEIMADQFTNSTENFSKDDFNKKIDFYGARLGFSSTGAGAYSLSRYFPEVLKLFSEAVVYPKFSAKEIENSKNRAIENLKSEEKNAQAISRRVYSAITYGKNTARGEFPTKETIEKIQLCDVQAYYDQYYRPNNAYLAIVGDVDFEEIQPLIEKSFSSWKKSKTHFPALKPVQNLPQTEIYIVDLPNVVQSVIRVGNITSLTKNKKEYFPAVIGNTILGGGADARLFMNLREKNALTYGAYSSLNTNKYTPRFTANTSVRNEVTDKAVTEIIKELEALSSLNSDEVKKAKENFKGNFVRSLEKAENIANYAISVKIENLPKEFYKNYLKSVDEVTPERITQVIKNVILPDQSRILIVGRASEIADNIKKLGYPVKYYDSHATPVPELKQTKTDSTATVETVVDHYFNAIGGKEKARKITSITALASARVKTMEISLKYVAAKGAKRFINISMQGNTLQKIVFNGKEGYMEIQGQKTPIVEKVKEEYLRTLDVFPELGFTKNSAQLLGTEKYNNEECYVIKEGNTTFFYSKKTGLKTGQIINTGTEPIPIRFMEYKEFSGIKFPYTIVQKLGGVEMNFKINSYQLNKATEKDFR